TASPPPSTPPPSPSRSTPPPTNTSGQRRTETKPPLPHCGRGRGPARSAGRVRVFHAADTLTRPRPPVSGTLSRNAGEGLGLRRQQCAGDLLPFLVEG